MQPQDHATTFSPTNGNEGPHLRPLVVVVAACALLLVVAVVAAYRQEQGNRRDEVRVPEPALDQVLTDPPEVAKVTPFGHLDMACPKGPATLALIPDGDGEAIVIDVSAEPNVEGCSLILGRS